MSDDRIIEPRDTTLDERRWIRQLKQTFKSRPSTLGCFSDGDLHVLLLDENGDKHFDHDGCVKGAYIVACITGGSDGGAW